MVTPYEFSGLVANVGEAVERLEAVATAAGRLREFAAASRGAANTAYEAGRHETAAAGSFEALYLEDAADRIGQEASDARTVAGSCLALAYGAAIALRYDEGLLPEPGTCYGNNLADLPGYAARAVAAGTAAEYGSLDAYATYLYGWSEWVTAPYASTFAFAKAALAAATAPATADVAATDSVPGYGAADWAATGTA